MATTNKYLTYRGDLKAVAAFQQGLAFTTVHPDGLPTAIYQLDVHKLELTEIGLPAGGVSLAVGTGDLTSGDLWVGGDDRRIYQLAAKAKSCRPLKLELPAPATSLVCLSAGRLAAVCGDRLVVVDAKKGSELQSFELTDKGTALAADPSGDWLAVGTAKGQVTVYQSEETDAFQISETEKLHDGAVTALLFEPEELRFFSAGADQKLLLTHARGKLEAEDRGRGASHADEVTAMLHVPGERFVTVSRDQSCKTWARAGATRPATVDDAIPAVVAAAVVDIHDRPHLVIAGSDNTLRFILLDAGGRFSSMTDRLYDAYDRASHLLSDNDVSRRGDAIHALAGYDDTRAVEMLARRVDDDTDHGLRLRAAELLAKSQHPRSAKLLEPLLKHRDDKVRLAAFEGLCNAVGKEDLQPLSLAIAAGQANVGTAAVKALEPLAKKDDRARQLLVGTLDKEPQEVRRAALLHLEKVFPKDSPESALIAARSSQADTRRLALIRSFQRKLLADARIHGAVRRAGEDADADVRRTAFLVALLSRPKLAKAIRERDKELHRQIFELENFDIDAQSDGQTNKTKGPDGKTESDGKSKEPPDKSKEPPKLKPTKFSLDSDDYEPLLSAMSSRVLDTSLLGACCLALLGDVRAFGTLLQLSREDDAAARVHVCRALAALQDPRAAQRLETLVNDDAAEVRDAAYSALEKIHHAEPLAAADVGLKAGHVDVRRRALKTLAATMRKSKAKKADDRPRAMMLRALNDGDDSVSGEAFKTTLGLKIDGSPEATLRFALHSVRENVRREVLTEAMAQDKEPWAGQLLIDLLDDPAPQIREDAYEHLLGKKKGRDIAPMQSALQSRHTDIRLRATQSLIKLKTKAAQEALVTAVHDDDQAVREQAVQALINVNAVEILQQAMSSKHTDVRLRAACARAMFHDDQAKAPLLQTATAPEPERDADKPQWVKDTVVALNGLGTLGDEQFVAVLLPLLDSKTEAIRVAAASSISRCVRPSQVAMLKGPLQHDDPKVRYRIAMGLAFCQDPIALPVVFSDEANQVLNEQDRLMAAVAYGEQTGTQLAGLLDSQQAWIRNAAFLVMTMRDWRDHDGGPTRVLNALSARDPRLRLAASRALESFSETDQFAGFLLTFINDRGDERAWTISAERLQQVADAIVFAQPHCQAQMMTVLETLAAEKQDDWDFTTHVYDIRYADEFAAAAKIAKKHKLPKRTSAADELSQLAFGTYVGLVREQGVADRAGRPAFGTTVVAVRQAAIRRLVALATSEDQVTAGDQVTAATRPVLIQALSDNLQAVRSLAFDQLANVGVDDETRAAAAIECGHTDLAVAALKLLTEGAGAKGRRILEEVVLSRDDELATEAGTLLLKMTDASTAAKAGLESPHHATRTLAVGWLAAAYDDDPKAKKALVAAYKSRHAPVRREVAIALAGKKDEHAFDMLIEQLPLGLTKRIQGRVVRSLTTLGDPRTPDALLTALQNDEAKSLDPTMIFSAIGSFRQPDAVTRLLPLLEKTEWRSEVAKAVVRISGYDQVCPDPEDKRPTRSWLEEQHPRHDEVLSSYLERCLELNLPNLIAPNIRDARWALTDAVDHVLTLLAVHPDEDLRRAVVEAIGWRFKKRNGPAKPLVDLLEHRDPTTRFLAAEGLARGGRDDGINVLLSAVELMTDLRLRVQAVQALGELSDERSLDVLLRLASEDGHALQESAAEAIGHLGKSDKADDIFALLKRLVRSPGPLSSRAIVGLRWFDTPSGWDLIRAAAGQGSDMQAVVLEQLGYNDDPATRALLLDALKTYWSDEAMPSARRLFGDESLEPDYAALQCDMGYDVVSALEETYHCLERVCRDGDPDRIFAILPNAGCKEELAAALMHREPLPVAAAAQAFDSPNPETVAIAASLVGRSGKKEHGKPVGPAVIKWLESWNERYEEIVLEGGWYFDDLDERTQALGRLAWAAGRTQAGKAELFELLGSNHEVSQFLPVRRAAALALSEVKLTKADLTKIERAAQDTDAEIRQVTTHILAQQDPARATQQASELVGDRVVFQRATACVDVDTSSAASEAAGHAHYQAVVLPQLVGSGNVERLVQVARDANVSESTRLGAIEGLARIAGDVVNEPLATIGKDESAGEEIRKAAWRGLRRAKRRQSQTVG